MTTAEAGLLRCGLFVHNDEGTHSGFKLVPEDTTLEELRNMTSACGILQWWREEQLDLYAMQDRRPCSEEQYGQKLMDLCHPDRSLYLLLRPRGFLCLATSCLAALEKRDQLAAQEPEDGHNQDTRALPYQQACSAPASGSGLVAASGFRGLQLSNIAHSDSSAQAISPTPVISPPPGSPLRDPMQLCGSGRWTAAETERLIDGVELYGTRWQRIASHCDLEHKARPSPSGPSTTLKCKWTNIKNGVVGRHAMRFPLSDHYFRKVLEIMDRERMITHI